ncbi:hypothetical protein [Tranquillimonas alkanivorans]|uniref:Uncharacterized protein n=1 Tax=Tranquillimonas alkanivorans TaxID=441119 RepID=A0A1I5WQG5_9RHOB|nr:hypothetical protein [Tranquillimonas alkanivorans]SFQ21950.1 hypothetical protein SAMN04488047_1536 [Tranquillimonas alkanivorans]
MGRAEPVLAAEGVVALAERVWPAFEHIDTSSGALGSAVRKTLEDLLPILLEAPADAATRASWLERLRLAIFEDGVDYLAPLSNRFGEIAIYTKLVNEHADRDLELVQEAWADLARFSHVPTATLTLSCLLEAERYDELMDLLALRKTRLWFDEKFGAAALLRQGQEDAALALAAKLLEDDRQTWGRHDISRFCEGILRRQGKEDEAYLRFGLSSASGGTWLAIWRDLVKRYPHRDAGAILEGLMALHGRKGKWFAAAKTAGELDIALDCAQDPEAAPATLIRAARDFAVKEPAFAAEVALHASGTSLPDGATRPARRRLTRRWIISSPRAASSTGPAEPSRRYAGFWLQVGPETISCRSGSGRIWRRSRRTTRRGGTNDLPCVNVFAGGLQLGGRPGCSADVAGRIR